MQGLYQKKIMALYSFAALKKKEKEKGAFNP